MSLSFWRRWRRSRLRPRSPAQKGRGLHLEVLEHRLLPSLTPHLLRDINLQPAGSNPASLVNINGIVYFSATDVAHGNELWRSDGTASGTYIVKDIFPGGKGSYPTSLTNV